MYVCCVIGYINEKLTDRLLFARNYVVNLLKFLLHSTTRARIEEDVFVFCLTVYLDIYVIVLEIKSKRGIPTRRERRIGKFKEILDAMQLYIYIYIHKNIYIYFIYIQHNHEESCFMNATRDIYCKITRC